MSTVAVIDYGMGNLHSIAKALQTADSKSNVQIVSNPQDILSADRVVFPGVGAIGDCMRSLASSELIKVIDDVAKNKPLLGICLGLQALMTDSEESGAGQKSENGNELPGSHKAKTACLNIIPGHVVGFPKELQDKNTGTRLKVPHMGWNQVSQFPHPLWQNIPQLSRFYFVHSYYTVPDDKSVIVATADYPEAFACAIARENIFAVQFHPEKSQAVGLQLLSNFLQWDGEI